MLYTAALLDDPRGYDTDPKEADEIRRLVLAWDEAREKWRSGGGKSAEKKIAFLNARAAVREHASKVRKHRRISTEAKLALGFELAGLPRG